MLNPDYRDILSAFESERVEYLVIGAYAVAAHGHPRATGDIDLWVRPTPGNAKRVLHALKQFGAPLSDVDEQGFQAPDLVFEIGVSPQRIDILTAAEGTTFEDAWQDRSTVELEGVTIPVVSKNHLIQNKRALGRHRDLADIENLGGDASWMQHCCNPNPIAESGVNVWTDERSHVHPFIIHPRTRCHS